MNHITRTTLLAAACLLLPLLARAQTAAPIAALREARAAAANNAAWNIPGIPNLPLIIPYYDRKAYAWVWKDNQWTLIPRNEARVLYNNKDDGLARQITGTLWIDGCYDVPAVPGENVLLLFRNEAGFKTYNGLPASESGIEVVKLDVKDGPRKHQLIRTAQLQRRGDSAATFGDKREPLTAWSLKRQDGVFYAVRVGRALAAGRYAFYLPDRAFEFEIKN